MVARHDNLFSWLSVWDYSLPMLRGRFFLEGALNLGYFGRGRRWEKISTSDIQCCLLIGETVIPIHWQQRWCSVIWVCFGELQINSMIWYLVGPRCGKALWGNGLGKLLKQHPDVFPSWTWAGRAAKAWGPCWSHHDAIWMWLLAELGQKCMLHEAGGVV